MKFRIFLMMAGAATPGLAQPATPPAASATPALEQRAAAGEAAAMVDLGRNYLKGSGVAADPVKAMEWFQKGAAHGSAPAQVGVGFLYSRGLGVPLDKPKAAEWFRKAADQGDAKGQYNLALLLHGGTLGGDKVAEALALLHKAAEQGLTEAQSVLGDMYFCSADGLPQDFKKAAYWLEKAAAGGDDASRTTFGSMLRYGNHVAVDQPRAVALFEAAAKRGYSKAMLQLGDALAKGAGTAKSPVAAAAWFLKAGNSGEASGRARWEGLKAQLSPEEIRRAEAMAASELP